MKKPYVVQHINGKFLTDSKTGKRLRFRDETVLKMYLDIFGELIKFPLNKVKYFKSDFDEKLDTEKRSIKN